ncbi:hypothetical protein GCM10007968_20370 [Sporolactobacillus putidus]|uniref:Uncharacterized protein n=1 Tax=Sporolactobacillus putidus TaxID=492735 RepID=A0A917S3U6_9BACL|nr:hypothetical protein GCM10007968_20370 [Sporolactobacillus putidus]
MLNPLLFRQILEKEIENSSKKSSIGILRKFDYWHQLSNSKPIYIFFSSVYYSIRGFAKEKINKA